MTYALGIDLGTTYTAAAVARDGRPQVAALGYRATSIPTVVVLTADGRFLVGEAAERRAAHEPDRVAREFKRRVGDPTPLLLGGSPVAVDRCLAEVLGWVVDTVAETEGRRPDAVTVTHPANWGEFKRDVLREALRLADVPGARLVPEPVAAATWYADAERLGPGQTVAVYDLGGGTFDAAVLRRRDDGRFEALGHSEGIERLGGIDVDQAVYGHVLRSLGDRAARLRNAQDPATVTSLAQLRRACVEAKEALSAETSVSIPVWLPGLRHEVLLHRRELEELVAPLLQPTVDALGRVVASAGLRPDDLDVVLLVGGSSRIPLIARQVSAGLGRPIAVDAHPKHPVSLGAALDAFATLPPPGSPGGPEVGTLPPPHHPGSVPAGGAAPAAWPLSAQAPVGAPGGTTPASAAPPTQLAPAGAPMAGPLAMPAPAGTYQQLPPLPPPRPSTDPIGPDSISRNLMVIASLATPVILLLVVAFTIIQGQDDPPNVPTTDAASETSADKDDGGAAGGATETGATEGAGETASSAPAAPIDLLMVDPRPALDGLAGAYDGSPARAREVSLYTDYAIAELQVPTQPTYLDRYTWREGALEGPEPMSLIPSEVEELESQLFDVSDIDPTVIPRIAQQTLATECPGAGFEISHIIIGFLLDEQLQILVYASHPVRGGGGYIAYSPAGTVARNACG